MSQPIQITLKPIVYGDTWLGMTLSMSSTGNAFATPLDSVRMHFRDGNGEVGLSLGTDDDTITVVASDSGTWSILVSPIERFPLAVGTWYWSIETTSDSNVRKTRYAGTKPVIDDATR